MEKLAVAIIPEQYTESFVSNVCECGAQKLIVFSGRGTAGPVLLQKLGLGATEKSIIGFFASSDICSCIRSSWEKTEAQHKDCTGIVFSLLTEKLDMSKKSEHTLICVIVKSGYGEAVMQAARKAGAPGGTIIDAKGTGTEQDMNFFGIQIVPEKETVLIVAETKTSDAITESIKKLPFFGKPDSGILCTFAAESCFHLGTHN